MEQSVTVKERTLRNSLTLEEHPALPSKQPTISGTLLKAVMKEIVKGSRASLKVFFVHGRPGEERPRLQGTTGLAGSSYRSFVVSTSPPCS